MKKNPFMSMWLSGANSVAGSLRGQATAQAKRHATAAITSATNEVLNAWTGAAQPASTRPKKKLRR